MCFCQGFLCTRIFGGSGQGENFENRLEPLLQCGGPELRHSAAGHLGPLLRSVKIFGEILKNVPEDRLCGKIRGRDGSPGSDIFLPRVERGQNQADETNCY